MANPADLSAIEAGSSIAEGRLTSEELVAACLERIEQRESDVGAWIHLDPDAAIAEARRRDQQPKRGPLHGVPVAVKDIVDTADMPTGCGSPIYEGRRPYADAACVALLRAAGMVVLGKTVTTEFAMRTPGKTTNPHNRKHTPGGSSSGSAAAVAAGMAPLAIGTQTAGSVIRPAAYCGIVGYKPTYGRIPRAGVKLISESLDTVGVMARSVADAAMFAAVLEGTPYKPPAPLEQPPVFGLCRSPAWPEIEPASETGLNAAADRARRAGAEVIEVTLPSIFDEAGNAHAVMMAYEVSRMLAYERENHWDKLSTPLKRTINDGRVYSREQYDEARNVQAQCRAAIWEVLDDVDVLLTPSAPGDAPEGLAWTGNPVFNRIWTMVGVPCVTVPGISSERGLPVGIQVVGAVGRAARTLACAAWLHDALRAA